MVAMRLRDVLPKSNAWNEEAIQRAGEDAIIVRGDASRYLFSSWSDLSCLRVELKPRSVSGNSTIVWALREDGSQV